MKGRRFKTLNVTLALAILCAAGPAWSLGALVSPDGPVSISASRSLIVRHADSTQLITQIKYVGTPASAIWLLALPNSNTPDETVPNGGINVQAWGQEGLSELDALTRPVLTGVCEGEPTGQMSEVVLAEQFGPTLEGQLLPVRKFSVPDVLEGDLNAFLDTVGVAVDADLQGVIDEMANQNLMFVALRLDTAQLGVNRIDPVVSITWPQGAGDQTRVALLPSSYSLGQGPANLVMWTLDGQRLRANPFTEELPFEDVMFVSPVDTNYTLVLDAFVGVRQTQMFVTEFAGPVMAGDFTDEELTGAIGASGATFLTRLRARIGGPALRTNLITTQLVPGGAGEVARDHQVEGYMCGGEMPEPDMGVTPEPDMGPTPMEDAGTHPDRLDASVPGSDATVSEGGGDDGGCMVGFGGSSGGAPLLLLLSVLATFTIGSRRQRR